MKHLKFTLAAFTITCAAGATAQNFDTLLNRVISNNPELMSSVALNRSELYNMRSDNTLPDPEVDVDYLWGKGAAGNKFDFSVSQGVDWPGLYSARGKVNKTASQAFFNENRSDYINKRLEIKLAMLDIVSAKKRVALLNERLALIDTLVNKYSTGMKRGEITILDLQKLKLERLRLNESLTDASASLTEGVIILTRLNGGEDCNDIIEMLDSYPDESILPLESYEEAIADNDPAIKRASLMVDMGDERIKAERLSRLPSFSLGYHYNREEGETFNGIVFGLKLPIFSTRYKVKSARALRNSYEYDRLAMSATKLSEMKIAREKAVSLYKKITDYDSVIKSVDAERLLRMALDGGQISMLEYLTELDFYLQAETEQLDNIYNYHVALASLNKYISMD